MPPKGKHSLLQVHAGHEYSIVVFLTICRQVYVLPRCQSPVHFFIKCWADTISPLKSEAKCLSSFSLGFSRVFIFRSYISFPSSFLPPTCFPITSQSTFSVENAFHPIQLRQGYIVKREQIQTPPPQKKKNPSLYHNFGVSCGCFILLSSLKPKEGWFVY